MKDTLKVFSWVAVVIGVFAILGGIDPLDGYALIGGILFLAQGWMTLIFIKQNK